VITAHGQDLAGTDEAPMNIGLVINTLNEEEHIAACIRSAKALVSEIVVCDMYSDDRTVEIAQEFGANIVYHERVGFVEPARKTAIAAAKSDWVLVLDADERLCEKVIPKLRGIVEKDKHDAIILPIVCNYFGDYVWHGRFVNRKACFFKREAYFKHYSKSEEKVHHNFVGLLQSPQLGSLPELYCIYHDAYPTIEGYAKKTLGHYAVLEARKYKNDDMSFSIFKMLGIPLTTFLLRYVIYGGLRDGVRGLIINLMYAHFIFLTWANLWFLEQDESKANTESDRQTRRFPF